ncbi:MAG TPA: type II secretion system F family protein [Candidatus Acidoferrum sp.]|nr:type II secretion system F family protein [Candidatus Acidoferrum sp.]
MVGKSSKPKRFHVSGKNREYFTSNLALLLKANVAVGDAFESLKSTTKSKPLINALTQMQHDVDDGMSLYKTMERSGIVSVQTLALVQLGEQSGNLAENLQVAAAQEEKQRIFHSKVRSALIYPVFVISITLVVGLGVAWFLLPRLSDTFSQLHVQLPLISRIFIGFGVFLQADGLWAVPAIVIGAGAIGYLLFGLPRTKAVGQALLSYVPGISQLLHEVEVARFGYLLGTLLDAGLSVTDALQLLSRASTYKAYQSLYTHLGESFEDGYSFAASFAQFKQTSRLLPPAIQQMVMAGERSGSLPETLKNIGTIYEQKADLAAQNLEAIIEPVLLIVVWLGVLGVAVSVILPIYSLVGGLGSL